MRKPSVNSESSESLDAVPTPETLARRARSQQRQQAEFLRGPIPLSWLATAATLGKLALSAGVLVWFRAGCARTKTALTVSQNQYKRFGLGDDTFNRALSRLESAGLVTIDRQKGKKSRVTLVEAAPRGSSDNIESYN